jgi:hypothetical protein
MLVPNRVFASDQQEPFIHYDRDNHLPEFEPQEVMALGEAPKPNLEDLDWRIPILEWMVEGKLPTDNTEA